MTQFSIHPRDVTGVPLKGVQRLGLSGLNLVDELGRFAGFAGWMAVCVVTPPIRWRRFVQELYKEGVQSLAIVCVCGLAVGMVLALQGYSTLVTFGATSQLGVLVGQSLIRELGPVLTALLITGQAGSATTAEIGTMVVTEQLDGLRMMAIDPVHFVVTPKTLAMIVAVPLLTALFIISGIYGGYLVGVGLLHVDAGTYLPGLRDSVNFPNHIAGSIVKSLVFGLLIGLISTYRGYHCPRTAEGVAAATTSSVVTGSVSILLFDYVVTAIWGV
jgi:phospholipid/cholesterol/gamma-HCH transport system permease protein